MFHNLQVWIDLQKIGGDTKNQSEDNFALLHYSYEDFKTDSASFFAYDESGYVSTISLFNFTSRSFMASFCIICLLSSSNILI